MKKARLKLSKGFTLIEMLIVIAIVGVLAVVLFAAINPLEQINKAKDGGKVSKAKEIINAAERYYAAFQADPSPCSASTLESAGELKSGDYSGITLSCSSGTYTAQFTPLSQTYKTKCKGGSTTDCEVPGDF